MTEGACLMEKIRSRCVEEGDCLIWPGSLAAGYCPCLRYQGKTYNLRRWLWQNMGKPAPAKGMALVAKCKDKRCLAQEHIAVGRRGTKRGTRRSVAHAAKMAAIKQAASSLSREDIEQIRISEKSVSELSVEYGKARRTIQCIQRGETWKVTTGVFAGLGARA